MQVPEANFAGAVIAVSVLAELIKRSPLGDVLNAWLSVILWVAGLGMGLALGLDWFASIFIGVSAMGIYSGSKHTIRSFPINGSSK